jgi:hypothetical protein
MIGRPPLEWALEYLKHGFSVIPIHHAVDGHCSCGVPECDQIGKHPRVKWKKYEDALPTVEEVTGWWTQWPYANVAIITGAVSGLVVVDVDGDDGVNSVRQYGGFPRTPSVHTGKGGHAYFQHPGFHCKNFVRQSPGLDFRGDGGYVVAPPSIHASGRAYTWSRELASVPLAEVPEWLIGLIATPDQLKKQPAVKRNPDGWVQDLLKGVSSGGRNHAATKLAGYYLRLGLTQEQVEALLLTWNHRNDPPMEENEVREVVLKIVARVSAERNQQRNFAIERILIVETEDPIYYVRVFGADVEMSVDDLLQFTRFQALVTARCQQVPQFKNWRDNWKPYVHERLQQLEWVPAPVEASRSEMWWAHIARWVRNTARPDETILAEERGVYSNASHMYFPGFLLKQALQVRSVVIPENKLWDLIRKKGGNSGTKRVKDTTGKTKVVRCWSLPKTVLDSETE